MGITMLIKIFCMLFSLSFTIDALATLYRPISVSEQINSSNAFVIGHVVSMESEIGQIGMVETKVEIKLDKWIGIGHERDEKYFKFNIPGGQIGDQVTKIPDNISFELGEKVLLFLKEVDGKFIPFYWQCCMVYARKTNSL